MGQSTRLNWQTIVGLKRLKKSIPILSINLLFQTLLLFGADKPVMFKNH